MFGFHRRTRSLIPVKELAKYDALEKNNIYEEEEDVEQYGETIEFDDRSEEKQRTKRLMVIYVVFLAEAIMASSLQPQLKMLLDNDDFCGNLSSSYLRSILECAYAFGCTAGIFWGPLADRIGRRPIALGGLLGMSVLCLCMGFATDLAGCAIFRFFAGLISSSILVVTLTMIGDVSRDAEERARNVAKLPLIAVCGSAGPLLQSVVAMGAEKMGEVWARFPMLSGQIACASVVLAIAFSACLLLEETLPREPKSTTFDHDCEKAAFLGQNISTDSLASSSSTNISIVDFDHADNSPRPIALSQFLQSPTLLVLLSSFSLLSLHGSTFDVLLPHLGHNPSSHGGMGLPCLSLGAIVLVVRAAAGLLIWRFIPSLVSREGLLKPFRVAAMCFPALYIATPVLAFVLAQHSEILTAIISAIAILVKHTLASSTLVLVSLLMLNAPPDAFSAGSVVGLMQIASLFRALAVAVSGASFYLSSEYSVAFTNCGLWIILNLIGAAGAAVAWFVRERPTVGTGGDFPNEVLRWDVCFDVDSCEDLPQLTEKGIELMGEPGDEI